MPSKAMPAKLQRLNDLAESPREQARYAAELLEGERRTQIVVPALRALAGAPELAPRAALHRLYDHLDAAGPKRDPAASVRISIIRVLRGAAQLSDVPLFERAASTYEFAPFGHAEEAMALRAEGLLALNEIDERLAAYHCARLLMDKYTCAMSGEPALTAVRILAAQGNMLLLYAFAAAEASWAPEAVSEALKALVEIPASLLPALVERHKESDDELILVGLIDLLFGHERRPDYAGFLTGLLRTTRKLNVYRYLVALIVAGRDEALLGDLLALAQVETDPRKVECLLESLPLLAPSEDISSLVARLRQRLRGRR